MGIFSAFFKFLKKLFDAIVKLIKKILPIVLLALAIWCGLGLALPGWLTALGLTTGTTSAVLLAGAAVLIDPAGVATFATKAVKAVGTVASAAVSTVAAVASTGISAFLSSPAGIVVLGLGAWYFLGSDRQSSPSNPDPTKGVQAA